LSPAQKIELLAAVVRTFAPIWKRLKNFAILR